MKLSQREVGGALRRLDPAIRLILLHGPDEGRSRALARQVLDAATEGGKAEKIDLSPAQLAADPGRLADEAAAVSMFGASSVILVDGAGEEVRDAVGLLLEAPAAGNPVVMLAGSLRKGSKLLALAESSPAALAFASYPPSRQDATRELARQAAAHGLELDPAAASALFDLAGGELGIIERELEVLALSLDASPAAPVAVQPRDLRSSDGDPGEAAYSALVDAVIGGQPVKADRQLASFAAQGVSGIPLLRAVGRRLWLLLELALAVEAGASPQGAIQAARPPVFWKERDAVAAQLRRWPVRRVRAAQARVLAAERDIKAAGSAGDVLAANALLRLSMSVARMRD